MTNKIKNAIKILKKYNQEHLIFFYDKLEEEQKKELINQIENTDFNRINKLYINSKKNEVIKNNRISAIPYINKEQMSEADKEKYTRIGEEIIKNGKLAVITLAGGQGTRLGYKGPKGCYEIDVPPKKSLFEFICDKLKYVKEKYGVFINWYIMTSHDNDIKTKEYFKEKNYFDYPKEKIVFFKQDTIEIIDKNGKILLDNFYTIKKASNGNGDIFNSFKKANLNKTLKNTEWIFISGIDNIILEIIDPIFIGLSVYNKSDISAKSIKKERIESEEWVFAKVDKKVNIISPDNLDEKERYSKNEYGLYNYNQINILSHLFSKNAFLKLEKIVLPYHRAFKKNDYVNMDGIKVVVKEPNSFKFEKFIFDSFKYFDKFTLLEVKAEDEFAPIKSFNGNQTPETALELYLNKNKRERWKKN